MTTAVIPIAVATEKIPASDLGAAAVEVFEPSQAYGWNALVIAADTIKISDQATADAASALALKLHQAEKDIDERDDFLSKPRKSFINALRGVIAGVRQPVSSAKAKVKAALATWQRAQEAEKTRMREEAERKHAAEVERIRKEHAEKVAKANEQAAREARELAELMGEGEQIPAPASAAPLPEPLLPPAPAIPKAEKSAVNVTKRWTLFVDDPSQIPHKIGDKVLTEPKRGAITEVFEAGGVVPGCRYEQVEGVSMNRKAGEGWPA